MVVAHDQGGEANLRPYVLYGLTVSLLIAATNLAYAADADRVSGPAMGNCLIEASNTVIKLRPSFLLEMIHEPVFDKFFNDKNEVGQPIEVARYNGKIDVVFAGRKAVQHTVAHSGATQERTGHLAGRVLVEHSLTDMSDARVFYDCCRTCLGTCQSSAVRICR